MPPDLTGIDKAILAALLRETIARDRFPLSPGVRSFEAILDKLLCQHRERNQYRHRSRQASAAWRRRGSGGGNGCGRAAFGFPGEERMRAYEHRRRAGQEDCR
jgi:hypothetical protein